MKDNLWERIQVFFWWQVMAFSWFMGIFWKRVYEHNSKWLVNYSDEYKQKLEKFK